MGSKRGTQAAQLAALGLQVRAAHLQGSVILWDGLQVVGARVAGATHPASTSGWRWWTDIPGGPHLHGVVATPQAARRAMVAHHLRLRASDALARLGARTE